MADRALIDQVAAAGIAREDAEDMADRVLTAMAEMLMAGRYVRLPGIGRLVSRTKPTWVPGYRGKRAYHRRTVQLASPAVLERGEPYEVEQ